MSCVHCQTVKIIGVNVNGVFHPAEKLINTDFGDELKFIVDKPCDKCKDANLEESTYFDRVEKQE
jgi:hypothetical protein